MLDELVAFYTTYTRNYVNTKCKFGMYVLMYRLLKLTQKFSMFSMVIVPCTLYSRPYQLSQIFCESHMISLLLTLILDFDLTQGFFTKPFISRKFYMFTMI